jgi:hypothetical protein
MFSQHVPHMLGTFMTTTNEVLTADKIRGVTEGTKHDIKWEDTMNECIEDQTVYTIMTFVTPTQGQSKIYTGVLS